MNYNLRKLFILWLKKNVNKESSRKKYLSAVDIISKEMQEFGVINKNLFEINTFEEYKDLYRQILANKSFVAKNETGHHMYSAALKTHYANFLSEYFECDNDIVNDQQTITFKNEIVNALQILGGQGEISEIYEVIVKKGNLDFSHTINPEKTLEKVLNNYSDIKGLYKPLFTFNKNDFIWSLVDYNSDEEYNSDISLKTLSKVSKQYNIQITEGERKLIQSYTYERDSKARKICIEHYGSTCQICGIDMAKMYGDEFKGKIHVHHKVPLNQIGESYQVDPIKDLIPVCPNCHMILHCKKDGFYTIEEIKRKINKL